MANITAVNRCRASTASAPRNESTRPSSKVSRSGFSGRSTSSPSIQRTYVSTSIVSKPSSSSIAICRAKASREIE
jgi:hypothetical protein